MNAIALPMQRDLQKTLDDLVRLRSAVDERIRHAEQRRRVFDRLIEETKAQIQEQEERNQ